MNATLDDWKNGWFGVGLGLAPAEVDALIAHLQRLKADPEQHFHIASEYKGNGGIGDIEVFVDPTAVPGNMRLSSLALKPGEDIPGHAV
ncbi:MAG: hypothetical protein JWQ76_4211 [Ramlibacter sp.]|nr:hypothetical protein [Ramlibacter sp.]